MPTATLLVGKRMHKSGKLFDRDRPTNISDELAEKLDGDDRFRVTYSQAEQQAKVDAGTSLGNDRNIISKDEKLARVRAAIADLDEEDETNFTADGRPDARALTKAVGFTVTAAMRDQVLSEVDPEDPNEDYAPLDPALIPAAEGIDETAPFPAPVSAEALAAGVEAEKSIEDETFKKKDDDLVAGENAPAAKTGFAALTQVEHEEAANQHQAQLVSPEETNADLSERGDITSAEITGTPRKKGKIVVQKAPAKPTPAAEDGVDPTTNGGVEV